MRSRKPSAASPGALNHPYLAMMADPFTGNAASIPDEGGHATMALRMPQVLSLPANADGNHVVQIRGTLSGATATYAITAGTCGAAVGADHVDLAAAVADFQLVRCATFSVEVSYTGSEINASGKVGLFMATDPSLTGLSVDTIMEDCAVVGPLHAGAAAVSRPYARPVFGTLTASTATYMPHIVVVISGAPTTACVTVRITRHLEFVPKAASLHAASAKFTPCSSCLLECGSNLAGTKSAAVGSDAIKTLVTMAGKIVPAALRAYTTGDPTALMGMF